MFKGVVAKFGSNRRSVAANLRIIKRKPKIERDETRTPAENKKVRIDPEVRLNEMNVQMLSKSIYRQVFKNDPKKAVPTDVIEKCKRNMRNHRLDYENNSVLPEVDFVLPKLNGDDIVQHFYNISERLESPYRKLVEQIVSKKLPAMPKRWLFKPGWHKYTEDGDCTAVPYPPDEALVFDVEVCMSVGTHPTLACAVSPTAWYGWVSEELVDGLNENLDNVSRGLNDLISIESSSMCFNFEASSELLKPKIIIGHNVSFDRARIKEQYWIERTGARFLDTMAMHVCISGVTSYQRTVLKTKNKPVDPVDESWMQITSLNSLSEVHKLYCGSEISKSSRDIFMEGSLNDVKENFEELMTYCAGDVLATAHILKRLYPLFKERFPHPATLFGMLELGSSYLPVNSNWKEYLNNSDLAYEDTELESKLLLARKANEACKLFHENKYKQDMWMWDQDWSVQNFKVNKPKPGKKKSIPPAEITADHSENDAIEGYFDYQGKFINAEENNNVENDDEMIDHSETKFSHIYKTKELLPVVKQLLPGYPAWYRKLCVKPNKTDKWTPGPINISTSMQITPKLLQLTWEGYPLHYIRGEGWGFLVPFRGERSKSDDDNPDFPFETLINHCPVVDCLDMKANEMQSASVLNTLWKDVEKDIGKREYYAKAKKDKTKGAYNGTGIWTEKILSGCCYFMRLPHKDGSSKRVGNPLARDFLNKFSENVLSGSGEEAQKVLSFARMLSYWRNNRDRIKEQIVIWLPQNALPSCIPKKDHREIGAILPQVVASGTLTRRAVEATWMTASNAHKERIGSELRAMIQSPPGYSFVGADVDSQELWIAAILGDSQFGFHGATPFGWMTLSGSKSAGTDMHSHTATAAKITRDHAKVINYARIYGAGQNFAEQLLKQFNPSISDGEAKSKALKMFSTTKGKKFYRLKNEYIEYVFSKEEDGNTNMMMSSYQATKIAKCCGKTLEEMFEKPRWYGGTESAMFNRLEEIAGSAEPRTPFLECRLTRALMSDDEMRKRHLPTAINWVVQSGAVDFLHLMLVNMAWLTKNKARFCLSFHDEVRYLVPDKYKYNVALALHITNLFVRAFCAKKLKLNDLPQSVAFFSSVEVDTVLRKDAQQDCITPSNPHGLSKGYGIPSGESLDIQKTLEKSKGNLGELIMNEDEMLEMKI